MEAMRSAIDPTDSMTGRAPLQLIDTEGGLRYPTQYGQLLDIDRFGDELIEPTFTPDELPPNEALSPLLIDSTSSTICVRGVDMVLDTTKERVMFNCFMAFAGEGWFSSSDVALALMRHNLKTGQFAGLARDLQERFASAAGIPLYLDNGRATRARKVLTNTDLVPFSMQLIRSQLNGDTTPQERPIVATSPKTKAAPAPENITDELAEPMTDDEIFSAFSEGQYDEKIERAASTITSETPPVIPRSTGKTSTVQTPVAALSVRPSRRDESRNWQDYGNCLGVDPDLFFPERGASTREAKETCRACVVREDCLEYALANGEKFGIWGGMSERERRRIRRQRALAIATRTAVAQ